MIARLTKLPLSRCIGPAEAAARALVTPGTLAFLPSAR
jgi:hypothetical protein